MTPRPWREYRLTVFRQPTAAILLASALVSMCSATGCRSAASPTVDAALARHARTAQQAFHDGYDEQAVIRYRLALRRAWEIDDTISIANTAFNLAACLAAMREFEAARESLAEARAELLRSGESQIDAWLLEAKIARAEGRLDEAAYLADCVIEPMIRTTAQCGSRHPTKSFDNPASAVSWTLSGANKSITQACKHQEPQDDLCQSSLVSLALFRANLFLDQADLQRASAELNKAEWANAELENSRHGQLEPQDSAMRAEIAATQSRLLMASGYPLAAARRLDDEVRWLKQSQHYRELPLATVAAAEAFLLADLPVVAAERFFRTARLLYGRDDLLAALYFLERSIELAVQSADADLQLRGRLLLGEIDRVNQKRTPSASRPPVPEVLPIPIPLER